MYKNLEFLTNSQEIAQTTNFTQVHLLEKGSLFAKGYGLVQNITL